MAPLARHRWCAAAGAHDAALHPSLPRRYFYVGVALGAGAGRGREVCAALERRFEGLLVRVAPVEKEDLEMLNHLSGRRREFLQVRCAAISLRGAPRRARRWRPLRVRIAATSAPAPLPRSCVSARSRT